MGLFSYDGELGIGVDYQIGVGISLKLKPIDLHYGFNMGIENLYLGPYYAMNYTWQVYPELQGGQMFWFTAFDLGVKLIYPFTFKRRTYHLVFANSIIGLTSRPDSGTETYWYSLRFADFVSNAHHSIELNSFGNYNHTYLELEFFRKKETGFSLRYAFEYFGYFKEPTFSTLNHSINVTWLLGK